jgi:hypothetical protein
MKNSHKNHSTEIWKLFTKLFNHVKQDYKKIVRKPMKDWKRFFIVSQSYGDRN